MACWWWYVSCPYKYLTKSQKNHVIPQICHAASEFIFPYKTILIGVMNSVNCKIYRGPGVPPMWMSVWTYKAMSMPTPLHSHQSVHELLCDQMLNGPYSCWVKHMKMKGEQTNGQMLKEKWSRFKVLSMSQMRRGFQEMDVLRHFAEHTRFVNSVAMVRLDQLILPLSKWSKCGSVAFFQNLHHGIDGILTRQVSFLGEFYRFN